MTDTTAPRYPEQGGFVSPDAVPELLPPGLAPEAATLLFVHAHPDDESIATGAAMARYAGLGARVELLTMTRGEMGEVIGAEHAAQDVRNPERADGGDALARIRERELEAACRELGVAGRRFARRAAAPGFFRDSGMSWDARGAAAPDPAARPDCLTRAPLREAADAVVEVLEELRPDVVVTYDADGGYGHPDHRRTHEAVMAALERAAPEARPRLVWGEEGEADPADERVQAVVRGDAARKRSAMAAHATQVRVGEGTSFALSNDVEQRLSGVEAYRLLARRADAGGPAGEERGVGPAAAGVTGVVLGLLLGFIGTMYHASILYLTGWFVPWGAVLAVLMVLAGTLWAAHHTRRTWATALPGVVAFCTVGLFVFARTDAFLVVPSTRAAIGVAGIVWTLGILAATALGVGIAGRRSMLRHPG
ncbi:PIG-L family deacetylase [Rothia sp. AR01]|uniref:PIG-L family deacetylase n=1 Tax=Rothia santali TaxID=2949643 RepID=A0A9X2KHQ4_9MICC|nr:PIG-L family deacetylase [Rothia santali]MCP3426097.1 PIG-L family deacetylase [Rothia santali]